MSNTEDAVSRRNLITVGAAAAALAPAALISSAQAATPDRAAAIDEMLDKWAIAEVLHSYPRGVDRLDLDVLLSIAHEDATLEFMGQRHDNWRKFMEWVVDVHRTMLANNHRITNMIIKVSGDKAVSETSATATLVRVDEKNSSQVNETWLHTRYLDQWTKRDGKWKIQHRQTVSDFRRTTPMSMDDFKARYIISSRTDKTDPSYQLFG